MYLHFGLLLPDASAFPDRFLTRRMHATENVYLPNTDETDTLEKHMLSKQTETTAAACLAVNIVWVDQNTPFPEKHVVFQEQKRLRSPVQP